MMFCRVCLDQISLKDVNSMRLIDSYSYNKPVQGLCTTSFFQIVSSCLPDLNLHLPIDTIPRVCGPCCIKICELYAIRQQSVEIEKILLHFVKFHNVYAINEPIKLSDVASMYHSVLNKKHTNVVLVDLLKQLFSACSIPVPKTEEADELNSSTNYKCDSNVPKTEELKTIINSNKDALILVVEDGENLDLLNDAEEDICADNLDSISDDNVVNKDSILEPNRISAEAWFKMSQTNLLPKEIIAKGEEIGKLTPNDKTLLKRTNRNSKSVLHKMLTHNVSKVHDLKESPKKSQRKNNNGEKSPSLDKTEIDNIILNQNKSSRILNNGRKAKLGFEMPLKTWNLRSSKRRLRPVLQFVKVQRKKAIKKNKRLRNVNIPKSDRHEDFPTLSEEESHEDESTSNAHTMEIENLANNNESNQRSSNSKNVHQCKVCEIIFSNENELKIHLCSTTTVQCEICNILFVDVDQWDEHKCCKPIGNITISNNFVLRQYQSDGFNVTSDVGDSAPDSEYESLKDLNTCPITCAICDKDFYTKSEHNAHVTACHVSIGDNSSMHEDSTISRRSQMSQPQILRLKDPLAQLVEELVASDEVENVQRFKCNQCPFIFGLERDLLSHLQNHKELYQCEECHKQYKYAYLLSRHKNAEHTPRQCGVCGKSFSLSHNLHSHMLSHLSIQAPISSSTDQEPIITDSVSEPSVVIEPIFDESTVETVEPQPIIVGQFTPSMEQLSRMSKMVNPITTQLADELSCNKCHDSFKTKEELDLHGHDHMIDIKFKCHICGEVFPSRPAYRMHVNSNCAINPQKSGNSMGRIIGSNHAVHKVVGKTTFTQRSNHSRLHECRLCQKKYISEKFLQIHFNNHARGPKSKFAQCQVCNAAFSSKHGLNRHFDTAHRV